LLDVGRREAVGDGVVGGDDAARLELDAEHGEAGAVDV